MQLPRILFLPALLLALSLTAPAPGQETTAPKVAILSTSPALTDSDLQIICLFGVSPQNKFSGALTLTNQALKGRLRKVCGMIAAYQTAQYIKSLGAGSGPSVKQITYIAGKKYASSIQDGINQAFARYHIRP